MAGSDMPTFEIVTTETVTHRMTVQAETEEQAATKMWAGEYDSSEDDREGERIVSIKAI
jgi:hypothetical protein